MGGINDLVVVSAVVGCGCRLFVVAFVARRRKELLVPECD